MRIQERATSSLMPPLKKTGPRATGTASNWRKTANATGSSIPSRDTATNNIFTAKERTATIVSIADCLSDHTTKRGGTMNREDFATQEIALRVVSIKKEKPRMIIMPHITYNAS